METREQKLESGADAKEDGDVVADAKEDGDVVADAKEDGDVVADAKEDGDVVADAKEDGDVVADAKEDGDVVADADGDSDGDVEGKAEAPQEEDEGRDSGGYYEEAEGEPFESQPTSDSCHSMPDFTADVELHKSDARWTGWQHDNLRTANPDMSTPKRLRHKVPQRLVTLKIREKKIN
ncbi:hypothetical protein F7725_020268 [Dissostichus mawsoni]|uniref:Uncharacterized protein n=1 Tax=Dissostichus mawsoni TaxID=36200 RepID=A0A7J5YCT5_DISMA|nr:hypothetical protein F7725_020268 [Dissostichus mawsoni]